MCGCCVVTATASTLLHRKILLMDYLLTYLLTVCAVFSLHYENLRIFNNSFFMECKCILIFWVIKGILESFINLVYTSV
jgi:hypothetical protein